jgi:hypothetical protein
MVVMLVITSPPRFTVRAQPLIAVIVFMFG